MPKGEVTARKLSNKIRKFWSRVDHGPLGRCWPWLWTKNSRGYGEVQLTINGGWYRGAHRAAYALAFGGVPNGLDVLHSCDNPSCVNPTHLRPGTHTDNMQDKMARGRGNHLRGDAHPNKRHPERLARGERQGAAKLTAEDVVVIRRRLAAGEHQRVVASDYGVTQNAVWSIKKRLTWRHVA